jgi:hypothetical protein
VSARGSDRFADLAAQYIEATLGVQVELWDVDRRQAAHDLRYEHEGSSVAVEVKRIVDSDFRALEGALERTGYLRDGRLQRSWDVLLRHDASVSRARLEIPAILVLLEETGWLNVWEMWQLRSRYPWLAAWLDRLGAENLWSDPPTEIHPPGFRLMPVPWGAFEPGIDALSTLAGDLLGSQSKAMVSLRRQLQDADADERHAFLFVGKEFTEGWPLMPHTADDEIVLPATAPMLPDPIDGLWLASESVVTHVIAWLPGTGWIEGAYLAARLVAIAGQTDNEMALLKPRADVFKHARKAANTITDAAVRERTLAWLAQAEQYETERHTIVHSILLYDGRPGFSMYHPRSGSVRRFSKQQIIDLARRVHEHADEGNYMSLFDWPRPPTDDDDDE